MVFVISDLVIFVMTGDGQKFQNYRLQFDDCPYSTSIIAMIPHTLKIHKTFYTNLITQVFLNNCFSSLTQTKCIEIRK